MTASDTGALLPVTQADRDAAAGMMAAWDGSRVKAADFLRHGGMDDHEFVQAMARHRLAAQSEPRAQGVGDDALRAPPEWKLVPVSPTDGMLRSGVNALASCDPREEAQAIWNDMLAASPAPPATTAGEG